MPATIDHAISPLTAQDIAFYREHGWIITPRVLDDRLIQEALQGLEEHWAGHRDRVLPGAGQHFVDWMPGDSEGVRNNEFLSLQNDRVRRFVASPVIAAMAGSLTGSAEVRLFDDQIFVKPAGGTNAVIGWHVDQDYWGTCSSNELLTAWIPLHDCPEELGPLVVLDGSHKWSHKLDRTALSVHRLDTGALEGQVNQLGYEYKPVTMTLKRGQFSFHNCRTIHGGYPNRGTRPRIAVALHLQDKDNSYRPAFRPDGRRVQSFHDMICRKTPAGVPDYTDEAVFPALWRLADDKLAVGA